MLEYEDNYLPLNEVFVRFNTKQMLKKLFNDGNIDQNEYDKFLKAAVTFHKESLKSADKNGYVLLLLATCHLD